jgi:hypothetical protein
LLEIVHIIQKIFKYIKYERNPLLTECDNIAKIGVEKQGVCRNEYSQLIGVAARRENDGLSADRGSVAILDVGSQSRIRTGTCC